MSWPVVVYLERRFPGLSQFINDCGVGFRVWLKVAVAELSKLVFLVIAVGLGCLGGLYFMRGSWFIFKDTIIGLKYIEEVNAVGAAQISWLLSLEFSGLILTLISSTVIVSLKVAVLAQLTLLRRYFYVGRSSIVKLAWVAIVCVLVSWQLSRYYPVQLYVLFGLCFLPTICILSPLLASAGKLLPELNLLLFWENFRRKRKIKILKDDIARLIEENSDNNLG